jgi:hypothetical protein
MKPMDKEVEVLKDQTNEHETKSKDKNSEDLYGDINIFKKGHKPGTKLVKGENYDLFADCHNILNPIS